MYKELNYNDEIQAQEISWYLSNCPVKSAVVLKNCEPANPYCIKRTDGKTLKCSDAYVKYVPDDRHHYHTTNIVIHYHFDHVNKTYSIDPIYTVDENNLGDVNISFLGIPHAGGTLEDVDVKVYVDMFHQLIEDDYLMVGAPASKRIDDINR